MKMTRSLCLASTSPRRRDMLAQFGLEFTTFAPDVDETQRTEEIPDAYVARMALEKASAALKAHPGHLILAGDTIVLLDGHILGKPGDTKEAAHMLSRLSGQAHMVESAFCLMDAQTGQHWLESVRTTVRFRPLTEDWIAWYSAQPEAWDKAGAYGIQGCGAVMLEGLEGSYANVVGLPIERVFWLMKEQGWLAL